MALQVSPFSGWVKVVPDAWELTPWWMFWRAKWRRAIPGPWHYPDEFWEYADEQKVARIYLEEEFSDT